jgi:sulfatase maturation enzyme AslB (radical SAM superfamily)
MQCPRLDHFVRFNSDGTVSRCGHMIDAPRFASLEEMEESLWLRNVKLYMHKGLWPAECNRCKQTESVNESSIRLNAINFDKIQPKSDYLIVGGVLDNICNSGCLTCDENHSTKIGSLVLKTYPIVDNTNRFWKLPIDRIVHLDINGGEPSASKNYKEVLKNLPSNVQSVRVNTNCSLIIDEIKPLIDKGVKVTVTVSLDGINEVHDFVRWPIKWNKFYENLLYYQSIDKLELNTWTTVSALNIHNFVAIKQFVEEHHLDHSYAFLHNPDPINVRYQNNLTLPYKNLFPDVVAIGKNNQDELNLFMQKQKQIRELV